MRGLVSFTFLLSFFLISGSLSAQDCYEKYRRAFNERGAEEVVDSTYDNIIISIRDGQTTNCYLGKVTVKNGKVLLDNFFIKLEDDTYENVAPQFKTYAPVEIKNGISQIILDRHDALYNVVFIGNIKPKKKGYMKAPDFKLD
ncbi:hypothetical protein KFE98_08670 [bacterium SCSIO 12741]|nr:hypothetical protein KFE98_08670 [bacterium SCSIO 12741]